MKISYIVAILAAVAMVPAFGWELTINNVMKKKVTKINESGEITDDVVAVAISDNEKKPTTVLKLKKEIKKQTKIPVVQQRILVGGKDLSNDTKLTNAYEGKEFTLVLRATQEQEQEEKEAEKEEKE